MRNARKSKEVTWRNLEPLFTDSDEEGSKEKFWQMPSSSKESNSHQFIDPRTGETIDLSEEAPWQGREKRVSMGRGKIIEQYKQRKMECELQKQLRLIRPLGFRNDMIESYFNKYEDAEDSNEPSPTNWEERENKGGNKRRMEKNVKSFSSGGERKSNSEDDTLENEIITTENYESNSINTDEECKSRVEDCYSRMSRLNISASCSYCIKKSDRDFHYCEQSFPKL